MPPFVLLLLHILAVFASIVILHEVSVRLARALRISRPPIARPPLIAAGILAWALFGLLIVHSQGEIAHRVMTG